MPSSLAKEDLMQEQILQAAKELFAVHGLAKVTMDDVAKAIGKGRSSLYYYYKSKEEIFDAVMAIRINELLATMEIAVDNAGTARQKIYAFFASKLKLLKETASFLHSIDAGMDAYAISHFQKTKVIHHNAILKREAALLINILHEGMASGELKRVNTEDMDTLVFVLLSTLHGLKQEMRLENNVREIDPVVEQLTRMIMNGLSN